MKECKSLCNLQTCLLCRLSLNEWIPAINASRKNLKFNRGEIIFSEGTEVTGIYFVYNGTVKVHKRWDKDKDLIVRFARKGDIVGHRGLGKDNLYPVSATAIDSTEVCFVDINFFLSSLKVNHDFLFQLMMFYAAELKESERNMRNLAHMNVKGRIAQALLTLQEKFGTDQEGYINIILSRQDLASFAGTSYETFFRLMNEFVEEKAISISGKKIAIINSATLNGLTNIL